MRKDKFGGDDSFGDKGILNLHSYTENLALIDIFRAKNPNDTMYTWVNGPRTIGCWLDRFYMPWAWKNQVSSITATPFAYSDHSLVQMQFMVGKSNPCGRGVWKFNTSLLKSEAFCKEIKNFWHHWRTQKPTFSDPRVWWDVGKYSIKQCAIKHSVRLSKDQKSRTAGLEDEYQRILSNVDPTPVLNASDC